LSNLPHGPPTSGQTSTGLLGPNTTQTTKPLNPFESPFNPFTEHSTSVRLQPWEEKPTIAHASGLAPISLPPKLFLSVGPVAISGFDLRSPPCINSPSPLVLQSCPSAVAPERWRRRKAMKSNLSRDKDCRLVARVLLQAGRRWAAGFPLSHHGVLAIGHLAGVNRLLRILWSVEPQSSNPSLAANDPHQPEQGRSAACAGQQYLSRFGKDEDVVVVVRWRPTSARMKAGPRKYRPPCGDAQAGPPYSNRTLRVQTRANPFGLCRIAPSAPLRSPPIKSKQIQNNTFKSMSPAAQTFDR